MWLSKYVIWFFIYSFFGWCWETVFVTARTQKWANRGFLFGPICPIYGVGACAISILFEALQYQGVDLNAVQIFVICVLGSMVLEYSTHLALEKLFHACWWDYSYMPLNINGRICLPYSLGFGVAGLLVIYIFYPHMVSWTGWMGPITKEFFGLVSVAVFASDVTLTVVALTDFEIYVQNFDEHFQAQMEHLVESIEERREEHELRLAKEHEKVLMDMSAHKARTMNWTSRSALKRVAHLSQNRTERNMELAARVMEHVEKFRKR